MKVAVLGTGNVGRTLARGFLGLGHEVGRQDAWVRPLVGDDPDLGRPRVAVDPDEPLGRQSLLGQRDVQVPRPDHHVTTRDAVGAVCHGCDRLGTTDTHDAVDTQQFSRREDGAVGPAVRVAVRVDARRWRAEDDLLDPGHLRRDDGHDDGRRIDGLATRDVDTGTLHGPVPHTHAGTVALVLPVGRSCPLVEPADLVDGALQRGAEFGRQPVQGCTADLRRHHEVIEVVAVEPGRECPQAGVAVSDHGRDHLVDGVTGRGEVDSGPWEPIARVAVVAAQVEHGQAWHVVPQSWAGPRG